MAKHAPRTYTDITKQIDALQKEAEAVLKKEVAGVIGRINEAIAFYGIQVTDLTFPKAIGGSNGRRGQAGRKAAKPGIKTEVKKAAKRAATSAQTRMYGDGKGHTWPGRGRKPKWLVNAMAESGAELSAFELKA